MKAAFLIIIFLPAIIGGCAERVDNSDWIEEKMYTIDAQLPSEARAGDPVIFTVKSYLPNSCLKFNRIGITSSRFDVYVTAYMKRNREDKICFEVITPIAEEGTFTPVLTGEYRFHFWRPDTLNLDYTVFAR